MDFARLSSCLVWDQASFERFVSICIAVRIAGLSGSNRHINGYRLIGHLLSELREVHFQTASPFGVVRRMRNNKTIGHNSLKLEHPKLSCRQTDGMMLKTSYSPAKWSDQ